MHGPGKSKKMESAAGGPKRKLCQICRTIGSFVIVELPNHFCHYVLFIHSAVPTSHVIIIL